MQTRLDQLAPTQTLRLNLAQQVLSITLNRPEQRNAMNLAMVHELIAVFKALKEDAEQNGEATVRAVVLRGTAGHFCAGGDIKDMAGARMAATQIADSQDSAEHDPYYQLNRAFGDMLCLAESLPQVLIVLCEGAVLGGGLGLACCADLSLSLRDAKFGLPETSLGIVPAQIAPFVVKRIGLTQARRLALLGHRFSGDEALALGLVHESYDDSQALEQALAANLAKIKACAPVANRVTKALLLRVGEQPLAQLLDQAAAEFSRAVQGPEGQEGSLAFVQKRKPKWAQ